MVVDQKVSEPSLPLVDDGEEGEAVTTTWIEPLGALHLGVVLSHLLKHPWRELIAHLLNTEPDWPWQKPTPKPMPSESNTSRE